MAKSKSRKVDVLNIIVQGIPGKIEKDNQEPRNVRDER